MPVVKRQARIYYRLSLFKQEVPMAKSQEAKKETKGKQGKSLMEKRAAKRAKREGK